MSLEHPCVARCLETGYPTQIETHYCAKCGAVAQCYGETSGYLCFDCARDEFNELTNVEAVELLGFEVIDDV